MSRPRILLIGLVVFFAWQNIVVVNSSPESEGWTKGNGDVYWKLNCDWRAGPPWAPLPGAADITSVKGPADRCGDECSNWKGCSHFTWTSFEDGTCYLKKGHRDSNEPVELTKGDAVCGWRYCFFGGEEC